jgi:hypothetical protein
LQDPQLYIDTYTTLVDDLVDFKHYRPREAHSFRASTTSFSRPFGIALETASLCRQAIAEATNLPFREEQAIKNGSMN